MSQPGRIRLKLDFNRLRDALAQIPPEAVDAERSRNDEEEQKLNQRSNAAIKTEEIKVLKNYNKTLKENNRLRRKYAYYIFVFTCLWTSLIFLILILQGFNTFECFYLSNNVLITLITTTTINVFGFFVLVVKFLFNSYSLRKPENHTPEVRN